METKLDEVTTAALQLGIKEFSSGKVRGIPAEEVFRRAMDDLFPTRGA